MVESFMIFFQCIKMEKMKPGGAGAEHLLTVADKPDPSRIKSPKRQPRCVEATNEIGYDSKKTDDFCSGA